jgi:23S rRNA pseudouridine1911/1915/1917 synthase
MTVPIDRGDLGMRVDRVLQRHLEHLPGVTRNRIQRLVAQGCVHINGKPVRRSSARVAANDLLAIDLPARRPRTAPVAEALPLDIVHEDEQLLIVNKPAGQVSHPAFRNVSGTLLNALLAHAAGAWTPALVSRLDKGTSGLVLVAKSRDTQVALQRLGERNAIEKDYFAVVEGRPPAKGTINLALDRDPWDRRKVTVRDRGGVPSVTLFSRLHTIRISPRAERSSLRCRLVTGRTHQIRVHLAAKGWPIVGDAVYGAKSDQIARQALHAWHLTFTHPRSQQRIAVTAPLPADVAALLEVSEIG